MEVDLVFPSTLIYMPPPPSPPKKRGLFFFPLKSSYHVSLLYKLPIVWLLTWRTVLFQPSQACTSRLPSVMPPVQYLPFSHVKSWRDDQIFFCHRCASAHLNNQKFSELCVDFLFSGDSEYVIHGEGII